MKPSSAKAKGRRLQQYIRDTVCVALGLDPLDVRSAIMGESGEDIKLSSHARGVFPFAIEAKNVERLNLWGAIAQAEEHAKETGLDPMVVFKRNHSEVWCALRFDDMLVLLKRLNDR